MTQTFAATEGQEKPAKPWGLGLWVFLFLIQRLIDSLKKAMINGCKAGVKALLKGMASSISGGCLSSNLPLSGKVICQAQVTEFPSYPIYVNAEESIPHGFKLGHG